LAPVLFREAFRIEDALIPDPTVVLYPEADDLDGQLIGFGMKLPRQIARRAAESG
jgi:hypothetical protein